MPTIPESDIEVPVLVTKFSDNGYKLLYEATDKAGDFDPNYWGSILGTGITGILDHLVNNTDIYSIRSRWSDAYMTPDQLIGSALDALSQNETELSSLSTRLDAFDLSNITPTRISSTELKFSSGTTTFSIKGSGFNADLFDISY